MRALLILLLLLLVQSGLLAFVLMLAGGGVGYLEPGYVTLSGTLRAERAGSPTRPTGIDPDRTPSSTAQPSR
jgi:hypothetical protein